jgi:cold-inducible RNA-binding protein
VILVLFLTQREKTAGDGIPLRAILKLTKDFGIVAFVRPHRPSSDPARFVNCSQKEKEMKNIFVGNLSFGATEDSLRSLFEAYGTVERVSVVTDRDTGQARGFGFVEMSANAEADRAIAGLNGKELDGRALNVNEARPKTERSGGGGGGGRRGGGGRY